ncbi:MAG: hypothetical protein Q8R92_19435 [Deltaproteobacteria bacterium]|nr:hypothetical protein [Deltaproteobacteria bacterium]
MRAVSLALLATSPLLLPLAAGAENVSGKVSLDLGETSIADVSPLVVYLSPLEGQGSHPIPPEVPVIQQKDARFTPDFLLVAAGQTVRMPNNDVIIHNVFSFSKGNEFDLGLYPRGNSRKVKLRHPGVVRIYCSIHESMNGLIFVSPSPYFAKVKPSGSFEIAGVPPGKYLAKTWSAMLPELVKRVLVEPGSAPVVNLTVTAGETGRH